MAARAVGILILLLSAFTLQADAPFIQVQDGEKSARIVFTWPEPVSFRTSVDGRELLLEFDRAVQIPGPEAVPRAAPSWIEGISFGFDTVLILAARAVKYDVHAEGREVIVVLSASSEAPHSSVEEVREQLRLDLLETQLYSETGQEGKARRLLDQMAAQYPNDLDVLQRLGTLERRLGRWRRARALYRAALRVNPRNAELHDLWEDLLNEQGSRVRFDLDRKQVKDGETQEVFRIGGHTLLSDSMRLGFVMDRDYVKIGRVRRADGAEESFLGVQQRGELYLQHESLNGTQIRETLFASTSGLGAGFDWLKPDNRGQTSLQFCYRRPYWEFIESAVGGGVRDRIELRRDQRLLRRLTGWVSAAGSRYGLDRDPGVAKSLGLQAGLNYQLRSGPSWLALQYGLDGEYALSLQTRKDPAGLSYHPLPLVSREVHVARVAAGWEVLRPLHLEGYGGYAWDRLGGHGSLFGAKLTGRIRGRLEAQAWLDRSLYSANTATVFYRFGAYLYWRF